MGCIVSVQSTQKRLEWTCLPPVDPLLPEPWFVSLTLNITPAAGIPSCAIEAALRNRHLAGFTEVGASVDAVNAHPRMLRRASSFQTKRVSGGMKLTSRLRRMVVD
ncbi:hypothetical protein DFH06DRAFT_1476512 [Mycena polygramma]|nr:hypothetical protein DFH06DRAFT_1476512 [Mycena polygramma]